LNARLRAPGYPSNFAPNKEVTLLILQGVFTLPWLAHWFAIIEQRRLEGVVTAQVISFLPALQPIRT
jgi:hypothetical protein